MNSTGRTTTTSWITAIRPKTLGAAVVPVLASTALASKFNGTWNARILVCALATSLFIQIATNLYNDAIDHHKEADTTQRLGPVRVSASGLIAPKKVYQSAGICIFLAICFSIPLVIQGGPAIFGLGLVSLFLSYGYTGGPFPLAYLGLGDLFVFLFFGLFSVLGTYFLQTQGAQFPTEAYILAIQIGLWATALIAINNFRDSVEDKKSKKNTLSVKLGPTFSRIEISLLLLLPFLIGLIFWSNQKNILSAMLPLIILPLAVKTTIRIWNAEPSAHYNRLLVQAGVVHLLGGLLLTVSFILK